LTTKKELIDSSDSDLPLSAFQQQQQQQQQSSSSSTSSTSKPMVLLPSKDKPLPVIESEDESDFPLSRLKKRAERRKNKREKQISLNKDSSKMDISPGISVRGIHNSSNKKQNNKKNNANSNKRSGKRKNKTLQVRATETENSAGDEGDNEEEDQ